MNVADDMNSRPELPLPEATVSTWRAPWLNVLLACGVLYAVSYVIVNDVLAATRYEGYSRVSQAISELSATAAPTRALLNGAVPVFSVLLMAFGIGVRGSAQGNRALSVTGALLIAHGATAPLWLLAPMTTRDEMGAAMAGNDVGHILLTTMTGLFILAQMAFGAAAFGNRFRIYSVVSAAAVLGFGVLTGIQSAKIPAGEPTPWLGLIERGSVGSWLAWLAVLAGVLLHHRRPAVLLRS